MIVRAILENLAPHRRRYETRAVVVAEAAHAAIDGMALLTRDAKAYRTSFPTLELVCP